MSQHLLQARPSQLQQHKIETTLHAIQQIQQIQQKLPEMQNKNKEEDIHVQAHKQQSKQNQTIHEQPAEPKEVTQHNEKQQTKKEQVQQTLAHKVDFVQLSECPQNQQEVAVQPAQNILEVNEDKNQTSEVVSKEQKAQNQIQISKPNELILQTQNLPLVANQTNAHEIKSQIRNEVKQQKPIQKEVNQQAAPKEQFNQDLKQQQQQTIVLSQTQLINKEDKVKQSKLQDQSKLKDNLQSEPNQQVVQQSQHNAISHQQQKIDIQKINNLQQPAQPVKQKYQENIIKQPTHVQEHFTQQVESKKSQQNKQNQISKSKLLSENLQNEVQKQLTLGQHKQKQQINNTNSLQNEDVFQLCVYILEFALSLTKVQVKNERKQQLKHHQIKQHKEPIFPNKEQASKSVQKQTNIKEKAEETSPILINEKKQIQISQEVEIVSMPTQQLQTHEEGKNPISPYEIAQEKTIGQQQVKSAKIEAEVVKRQIVQQNKTPNSEQKNNQGQVQTRHQIKNQQTVYNQNAKSIHEHFFPTTKQVQQPQIKQSQNKKSIQNQQNQNVIIEIKQNIIQWDDNQPQKQEEERFAHKHKIRVDSEYIQSVTEQYKQKQKKVVEFTQFVPTEYNENTKQRLQDIDKVNKLAIKTEVSPEKPIIQQQQQQLKATFNPNYQSIEPIPKNKLKPTQIAQNIVQSKQSPRKQYGKISKRILYDKKVHEIVKELNKYDEKKIPVPELEVPKKSSKKLIDLSKLDTHIDLASNVMNLTIGELTSQDAQVQSSDKLLAEIESLKKKLSELQRKKEERLKHQEQSQSPEKTQTNNEDNPRVTKKQFTGRIIKKTEQPPSRQSQQVKPMLSSKKSDTIAIEPATISSASKKRITSTLGFQTNKQLDGQLETDMSKTMAINFRVRRPSKHSQGVSQFQSNQKQPARNNRQRLDSDKCFQTSRRQEVFEKLQFTQEESLTVLEKPTQRQLQHQPYFRDLVQKYFVEMGKQIPTRQMDQQEFVDLAKKTFRKFGVNLQAERSASLSVKKYKNCISFILDSIRTIIWYYQGKFYFGGWMINQVGEGEKSGWGYEYVPGKYVYSGTFKENKREGYGIIKFLARQNDTIYEGGWSNGFKQSLGKQIEPDGVEYIGSWTQGKKHGYGTIRISQCEYYSGHFSLGIKNGQGTEVFKNGDRYVGGYRDGKFQGKGTYTWSNYSKYQGDFIEGIRNGYGFWIANYLDQNSDRYEGQYKNDKKNGYGVYKWKDGTTYQGQFLNDLKHGQGTVSYGDGRRATLQWSEGSVVPRPTAQKSQRNSIKRGSSRAASQKSESKGCRFDAKLNLDHKSRGKKVFNGIDS